MLLEILRLPLAGALLWSVLHSLDYFLTLEGARVRKLRAAEVIQMSGSYELNPLFRKVIDEGRWWSRRFLVSLIGGAGLFAALNFQVSGQSESVFPAVRDALIGGIVFTRLSIIGRHLQNIWLSRRMAKHPQAVTGLIRYNRGTVMLLSAFQFGTVTVLLGVAAIVERSPFLIGGAVSCGCLTVLNVLLALKHPAGTDSQATLPVSNF
jgi:hypothetical protein